jgi:hypothetical protein
MASLRALVLLLSSPQDGEALAAARALGRMLARDGKDFHWLADHLDGPAPHPNGHDRDLEDHRAAAEWVLRHVQHRLRPKEVDFLETMTGWLGDPTPKQAAWLSKLCARYGYRP